MDSIVEISLSIANLQRAHIERQEEWCPDQKPDLSFRGNELGGECGEALNVIKKLERERHGWRGSRDTVEHLAEELADVIHCTVLVAITAGIDLQSAVIDKFNSTSLKNGLATLLACSSHQAVEPVSVPDGWKLVPVEPTSEMLSAVWSLHHANGRNVAEVIYESLLTAAPSPPASTDLREENDRKPVVPLTKGMPELRSSLIARAVRQSLKNYGHKCAESVLPECIAVEVETALRAHEKAWPARECGPDGGPLLESRDHIGSAYTRAALAREGK